MTKTPARKKAFLPIRNRDRGAKERCLDLDDYTLKGVLKLVFMKLEEIFHMGEETQAAIDEMRTEVERLPAVIDSVKTLIQSMADQITEAADDPEEVRSLATDLRAQVDALSEAVVANTPQAPVEPEPEAPEDEETPENPPA